MEETQFLEPYNMAKIWHVFRRHVLGMTLTVWSLQYSHPFSLPQYLSQSTQTEQIFSEMAVRKAWGEGDFSPLTPFSEQLYYFSWNLPEKFSLTQALSMENFSLST